MKKKIVLFVFLFMFLVSYASAQKFKSITADELKKMFDKKTKVVLVDARTGMEYAHGHIPMAINIPPDKLTTIATLLPKNKNTLVVFYCRGVD
jgi:rhodanese-related sulfurtransferase